MPPKRRKKSCLWSKEEILFFITGDARMSHSIRISIRRSFQFIKDFVNEHFSDVLGERICGISVAQKLRKQHLPFLMLSEISDFFGPAGKAGYFTELCKSCGSEIETDGAILNALSERGLEVFRSHDDELVFLPQGLSIEEKAELMEADLLTLSPVSSRSPLSVGLPAVVIDSPILRQGPGFFSTLMPSFSFLDPEQCKKIADELSGVSSDPSSAVVGHQFHS